MKRGNTLRRLWSARLAALIALTGMGLLAGASEATAGCYVPGPAGSAPTAYVTGHAPLLLSQQGNQDNDDATIVGMWHVIYTATYSTAGPIPVPVIPPGPPDSFQFAETMKTWHGDGTEWEEKIEPAPGGFCYGVWKSTNNGSVKLHHFGAVTDPNGTVVAIFYQDEINRVAAGGRTYVGTWDFKIYGPADVLGKGPVLQEISGTAAATRITVK
jgi:hypothetical protein